MSRTVLLNPGPVNVSDRVRQALLQPDLCHREPEYFQMARRVREKLLQICDVSAEDYTSVLISGSGTSALEAAVSSSISDGGKLLVIENGIYGERITAMAGVYRIPTVRLHHDWGELPNLEALEKLLAGDDGIEMVAMIHQETTTGLINPVAPVAKLAKKYGKTMLLDSISGLAGDPLDVAGDQIDILVGTANKCIQGFPGVAFLVLTRAMIEKMRDYPKRTVYFDAVNYFDKQEADGTPFTPAVQITYAFEAALDELLEETVAGRTARYAAAANFLRDTAQKIGLEFFIPREHFGNTLTALSLPEGMTYDQVHDALKASGFVIYAGQGGLVHQIFRIANMGGITQEELDRLAACMGDLFAV